MERKNCGAAVNLPRGLQDKRSRVNGVSTPWRHGLRSRQATDKFERWISPFESWKRWLVLDGEFHRSNVGNLEIKGWFFTQKEHYRPRVKFTLQNRLTYMQKIKGWNSPFKIVLCGDSKIQRVKFTLQNCPVQHFKIQRVQFTVQRVIYTRANLTLILALVTLHKVVPNMGKTLPR